MHIAGWLCITSQDVQEVPWSDSGIGQLLGYMHAQQPAAQAVAVVHSCISHRLASSEDIEYDRFCSKSCVELLVCALC